MKIGIAGGGQLGRMLTDAAHALGHSVIILDPTENSPAMQASDESILGDYKSREKVLALSEKCDVLTFEIESVNTDALDELCARGFPVHPTPGTLRIIKDKLFQKKFLQDHDISVAPFHDAANTYELSRLSHEIGYPLVLKSRFGAYDGRGNATVNSASDLQSALEKVGKDSYVEEFISFEKELAIVAARTIGGVVTIFPLVETIHKNHICHEVLVPARVPSEIAQKARALAEDVLQLFEGAGVFAIEMFLESGKLFVNEIAPRVHNSGHFSIEACHASQFEQHIRAITGMDLADSSLKVPAAAMINILGERSGKADPQGIDAAEKIDGVKVHMYGKMETRVERKMGHLTAVAATVDAAKEKAERARALISI